MITGKGLRRRARPSRCRARRPAAPRERAPSRGRARDPRCAPAPSGSRSRCAPRSRPSDFVSALLHQNTFQETPALPRRLLHERYAGSAPPDRVMGGMARAFGLPHRPVHPHARRREELFLTDLFRRIIFGDRFVARTHAWRGAAPAHRARAHRLARPSPLITVPAVSELHQELRARTRARGIWRPPSTGTRLARSRPKLNPPRAAPAAPPMSSSKWKKAARRSACALGHITIETRLRRWE